MGRKPGFQVDVHCLPTCFNSARVTGIVLLKLYNIAYENANKFHGVGFFESSADQNLFERERLESFELL